VSRVVWATCRPRSATSADGPSWAMMLADCSPLARSAARAGHRRFGGRRGRPGHRRRAAWLQRPADARRLLRQRRRAAAVALAVGTVAHWLAATCRSPPAATARALSSRWLTGPGRRARAVLSRSGGSAVLIGQWVVGARTLTPRFAAAAGLSYRRFLPWNLPSAAVWGLVWVAVGYGASEAYQQWSWVPSWPPSSCWLSCWCLAAARSTASTPSRRRDGRFTPARCCPGD